MDRLATIAVFKAVERLAESKDVEGILDIAQTVLREAQKKPDGVSEQVVL